MAKRWSKQPSERGLARICQGPIGYNLREGGKIIARVRPKMDGYRTVGWYWYGFNHGDEPMSHTAQEAKDQAVEWIKKNVAKQKEGKKA